MICPNCGANIRKDAAFCTSCGAEVAQAAISDPGATSSAEVSSASKTSRTKMIVGVSVGAVVLIALIVGIVFWFMNDQANKAKTMPHSITISINAAGYSSQDTLIPIRASGIDLNGNYIDELFFVNNEGEGIALPKGYYNLSVEASPLTADGILFKDSTAYYELPVAADLDTGVDVDATSEVEVVLEKSTALDQTQEMIDAAYDAAIQDPDQAQKADELAQKAQQVHEEAVATKQREEEERAAQEKQAEFERNWIRRAQTDLHVPFKSGITYEVSFDGPGSFWEGAGIYVRNITFYENGEVCASALCDAETGEPARNMLVYPGLMNM